MRSRFQSTQNGNLVIRVIVMLEISNGNEMLDGFSLVCALMYGHSKSTFLQVTLNFELE